MSYFLLFLAADRVRRPGQEPRDVQSAADTRDHVQVGTSASNLIPPPPPPPLQTIPLPCFTLEKVRFLRAHSRALKGTDSHVHTPPRCANSSASSLHL